MRYVRVLVGGEPRFGEVTSGTHDSIALYDGNPAAGGRPCGETLPLAGAQFTFPVAPSKIIGVGLNYRAHAAEMGKPLPEEPLLFMKPPSALLADGAAIVRPPGYQRTDYEGELGVVIGRRTRRVSEAAALDCVFGYTIVNDVSVRDLQKKDVQYTRAKGFDSFCPVGPALVTGLDPRDLALRTRHNGALKQDSSTRDLIFSVAQLVAFISSVMTLEPGDLITTGTPPGVGPIAPGDRVEIEIEGIGVLRNPVIEQPQGA